MLFASLQYMLFLPAVVLLFWFLPKSFRMPMLLIASWYFYSCWCPPMVLLIIAMTVANFYMGRMLSRAPKEKKRTIFGVGTALNLLCLGVFKYGNFAVTNVSSVVGFVSGNDPHWTLNIILPLAISFFTFEFIHYLFEIYRGNKPIDSFVLFSLFAAFFPTQIAGPIKRYPDFVKQMTAERPFDISLFDRGLMLIIIGLAKKVLVADNLSALVNMVMTEPGAYGSVELWIMALAFTFQIYFDFSGYSDIARGSAMLFGYDIPINFNMPFASKNIAEFWQRWHMSLSSWLRDYVFLPVWFASKRDRWQTHKALFLTMVICGFWHGASWTFMVWGAFHGLALIIHREFADWRTKTGIWKTFFEGQVFRYMSIVMTFLTFCVSLVIFRSPDIQTSYSIIKRMFIWKNFYSPATDGQFLMARPDLPIIVPLALFILALMLIQNLPLSALIEKKAFQTTPVPLKAAFYTLLVVAMLVYFPSDSQPFIYFQF